MFLYWFWLALLVCYNLLMSENTNKVYAFIVDGDVFATLHISAQAPNYERIVAGFSSAPIVVDATSIDGVSFGWTYDGENFIQPSE